MRHPVSSPFRITSKFGVKDSAHKIPHNGTDYVSGDKNVYAIEAGTCKLRYDSISGWGVNLYGPKGRKWECIHLFPSGRVTGKVKEGQVIGKWGETKEANVTGPHLHLGLQINEGPQLDGYAYIEQHKTDMYKGKSAEEWYKNAVAWQDKAKKYLAAAEKYKAQVAQLQKDVEALQNQVKALTKAIEDQKKIIDKLSQRPTKEEMEAAVADLKKKLEQAPVPAPKPPKTNILDLLRDLFRKK